MAQAPVPADLVAEIQNMFYDKNMTKAEIARQTGMSYTTVAKYIPVRAGYSQRCSNKELAERQLAVKKPIKKTEAETPVGKTFTVKKPAATTMKIRQPMAELPDAVERDISPFVLDAPGR